LNLSATKINISSDHPSIQAGIDIAVDGDAITVQPVSSGVYLYKLKSGNLKNLRKCCY